MMRLVGEGRALSRRRCAEWIDESLVDYATRGYGASAVHVAEETRLAGYCGIVAARRRSDPEIIYALRPELQGQGLGTELVKGLLDFGFGTCGLRRLVASIRPENIASLRVAEKAGMHCAAEELGPEGIPMLIYVAESPAYSSGSPSTFHFSR